MSDIWWWLAALPLVLACQSWGYRQRAISTSAAHPGLTLWSGLMTAAHGVGMMLTPPLMPLCLSDGPASASAPPSATLLAALAMVGLHAVALLAVKRGAVFLQRCRSNISF